MFRNFGKGKKNPKDQELHLLKTVYIKVVEGDLTYLKSISNLQTMKFTNYNWNILHLAVWYEKFEIVEYLLSQTYKSELLNVKDNNQEVPLHLSAFNKNADIFGLLVRSGANSDDKNMSGQSALEVIQLESERLKFLTKIKNKNETGVENEKIPHLFDSLSNSGIENNEEKIEINTRSFSADITSNIDKWGLDIPFELISSDKEKIENASQTNNNYNNRLFFELKMKNLRLSEEYVDFKSFKPQKQK